jgi:AcrR family transcriptional regulator
MHTPPRILRAEIEDIPGARPRLSARERERQAVILAAGRRVLVNHGRAGIRLADLAIALGMAPATIRRYFPDLDDLLGEILRTHLLAISSAIGEALSNAPATTNCANPGAIAAHRQATARAAYLAATRTVLGFHTEAHLLLMRERHHLPPDLFAAIEGTRAALGEVLAGDHWAEALGLLDLPELSPAMIEGMLRVLVPPARTAAPRLQVISRMDKPAARIDGMPDCVGAWAEPAAIYAGPINRSAPDP